MALRFGQGLALVRPRVLVAVLLFPLLGLACHQTRPVDASAWTELRSPHFTLRTDLPEADARTYVTELERMRDALFLGSWHAGAPPPGRLLVTVVADSSEVREFLGKSFAGVSTTDVFGDRMLLFSAEESPSQLPALKHELAHWLNGAYLLRAPRWLNEGLACYLQTARTDASDGTVVIGEPDRGRLAYLMHHTLEFGRVLHPPADLDLESGDDLKNFYAGSWVLVHYLVDSDRARFGNYLQRLAKAEDPSSAFAAVYPELDALTVAKDVHDYLKAGRMGSRRLTVPAWTGDIEVRPLAAAELRAQRANLMLLSFGLRRDEGLKGRVLAETNSALAADPDNPLALAISFALLPMDKEQQIERARASTQAHPDDERAFRLLAAQLEPEPARKAETIDAYQHALALAPDDAAALNGLAQLLASSGRFAEAAPLAEHALRVAPGSSSVLDTLATVYVGAGRCAEGLHAGERALEVLPDGARKPYIELLAKRQAQRLASCAAAPSGADSDVAPPAAGQVKLEPKSGLQFVYIPAGSFHLGCEPQDTQCFDDEKPGRSLSVAAFWLGKTDVTVEAYAKCVKAGVCSPPNMDAETCNYGRREDHPVNCLDWEQAKTFCAWLGGRLPTAEEWEYAAKGGASRIYPWGDEPVSGRLANYCDKNCPNALNPENKKKWTDNHWIDRSQDDGYAATSPVGHYPEGASNWGLLDMAGNVWQWTATDYDANTKELRGGGWSFNARPLRASNRNGYPASARDDAFGVRCGL